MLWQEYYSDMVGEKRYDFILAPFVTLYSWRHDCNWQFATIICLAEGKSEVGKREQEHERKNS